MVTKVTVFPLSTVYAFVCVRRAHAYTSDIGGFVTFVTATPGPMRRAMMTVLDGILRDYSTACKESPDALGEVLRAWAFPGNGRGCYSTFDVRPEFAKVEPTEREFRMLMGRQMYPDDSDYGSIDGDSYVLKSMEWFRHPNGIELGWYWDGDGMLAFYVPELADDDYSGVITNSDCKKSYGWDFATHPDAQGGGGE